MAGSWLLFCLSGGGCEVESRVKLERALAVLRPAATTCAALRSWPSAWLGSYRHFFSFPTGFSSPQFLCGSDSLYYTGTKIHRDVYQIYLIMSHDFSSHQKSSLSVTKSRFGKIGVSIVRCGEARVGNRAGAHSLTTWVDSQSSLFPSIMP